MWQDSENIPAQFISNEDQEVVRMCAEHSRKVIGMFRHSIIFQVFSGTFENVLELLQAYLLYAGCLATSFNSLSFGNKEFHFKVLSFLKDLVHSSFGVNA